MPAWLGYDNVAVGSDFRYRVPDLRKTGNVLVSGIGKISARHLRTAFEQVSGERPGCEAIPVVGTPAERMQQWTERESGIGDPPGHDDIGVLVERVRDRLRAEIKICGDNVAHLRQNFAAGFAPRELAR